MKALPSGCREARNQAIIVQVYSGCTSHNDTWSTSTSFAPLPITPFQAIPKRLPPIRFFAVTCEIRGEYQF